MWKKIPGFSSYEAHPDGLIRSYVKPGAGAHTPRTVPVVCPGCVIHHGYVMHTLRSDDGRRVPMLLHRIIATTFLPNPLGLPVVAHNDGDTSHNSAENLRWDTQQGNQNDMLRHGTSMSGEKCCTAKLTKEAVFYIRQRVAEGGRGTQRRLSEELKMSPAQINRIVKGNRWRHLDL